MKRFVILCLLSCGFAVEVLDKPEKNANLLIIGDVAKLKVMEDSYVHVYDSKTRVYGYVLFSDYQKALMNAEISKKFPGLSDALSNDQNSKDKAALIKQNIKNKQAQFEQLLAKAQL